MTEWSVEKAFYTLPTGTCKRFAHENSFKEIAAHRAICKTLRPVSLHVWMGGDGVVIFGEPFKKKGMHQKTFNRLMRQYRRLDLKIRVEEIKRFGRFVDASCY